MAPRVVKEHEVRRHELLGIAQQLFLTKGYEATSIRDIIATAGVAKGTFYHYFKSKEDLLDELAALQISASLKQLEPIVNDNNLNAVAKLQQFFEMSSELKLENLRRSGLAFLSIIKEENLLLRYRIGEVRIRLVSPLLSRIIQEGVKEGVFRTPYPDDLARLLLRVALAFQEENRAIIETMGTPDFKADSLLASYAMFEHLFERMLELPDGSIHFFDRSQLEAFSDVIGELKKGDVPE